MHTTHAAAAGRWTAQVSHLLSAHPEQAVDFAVKDGAFHLDVSPRFSILEKLSAHARMAYQAALPVEGAAAFLTQTSMDLSGRIVCVELDQNMSQGGRFIINVHTDSGIKERIRSFIEDWNDLAKIMGLVSTAIAGTSLLHQIILFGLIRPGSDGDAIGISSVFERMDQMADIVAKQTLKAGVLTLALPAMPEGHTRDSLANVLHTMVKDAFNDAQTGFESAQTGILSAA